MSAIAGFYRLDGRDASRDELERMVRVLTHRGRLEPRLWVSGPVGLGQVLGRTAPDPADSGDPWSNPAGGDGPIIAADARLDQRAELGRRLGWPESAALPADPELIQAAWAAWGERCLEHLLGDFSFAVWDARRQAFFLARDHAGVRPLYYYHSPRLFAFASEIKALLALAEVPHQPNEIKLADMLVGFYEDKESTCYQGIRRLAPAHLLEAGRERCQARRYWALDGARELRLGSDAEYAEAFHECFSEAVRCRLDGKGTVGTQLSGGLDSSAIACVARQAFRENDHRELHTFSAVFPARARECPALDERSYINAVLDLGGFVPHEVAVDDLSPAVPALWQIDEFIAIPNIYMEEALYCAAREQGVSILLSGHDGDDVVSYGYEYLEWLGRRGRWLRLWGEARALARAKGWNFRRTLWQMGLKPLAPEWLLRFKRRLRHQPLYDFELLGGVLNPDLARRIGHREHIEAYYRALPHGGNLREGAACMMTCGLDLWGLEFFNQFGARFAIEPRFPFYDKRLMEFCLAVPFSQKLRQGRDRDIFRRAMAGVLPPAVARRTDKGNLSGNFNRNLFKYERATLHRLLHQDTTLIAPYVDLMSLRHSLQLFCGDPLRRHRDAVRLFSALCLHQWLQRHFD